MKHCIHTFGMQQLSLSSLLLSSGAIAAVLVPLGFGAISVTKLSPKSFQVARICFIGSGVVPLIAVLYTASQFQMLYWQRLCVAIIGGVAVVLPVVYLLRLVDENETAHSETEVLPALGNKPLPKFEIQAGPNIADSYSMNWWGENVPVRFLHPIVLVDDTIPNCKAYLTRIGTNKNEDWMGQEQLTWSPSEAHDHLIKTLHPGIRYPLDVLAVTSNRTLHVCNENRDWRRWPRLHDIFSEAGDYFLAVAIAGDGVIAQTFTLRFEWTGDWQTSFLHNDTVTHQRSPEVIAVINDAVRLLRKDHRLQNFPLRALQLVGVGNLQTEDDFAEACEGVIQHNFPDPLVGLPSLYNAENEPK
jgi:hypothetical protein